MIIEALVGLSDQLFVEPLLSHSRLVSGDQQNRPALGIERESDSPDAVGGIEAQLLHVRVPRSLESVRPRAAKLRPERLQKFRVRQQLVLNRLGQFQKFSLERSIKQNRPCHPKIMASTAYVFKRILRCPPLSAKQYITSEIRGQFT